MSRLVTLAGKLDVLYGKKGQPYPNPDFPNLGYVLNAMFDKANQ